MKFWKSNNTFYENILRQIIYPSFMTLQAYRLSLGYYFTNFSYEKGPYFSEEKKFLDELYPEKLKKWYKVRDIIMKTDIRNVLEEFVGARLGVLSKDGKVYVDPQHYFFKDKTLYLATSPLAVLNKKYFDRIHVEEYTTLKKQIKVNEPYRL